MGSRNLKTIKGKEYLYYVISEDKKKRAIYCGLASKPESEKKFLRCQLEEFIKRKKVIIEKINDIKSKLNNF